MQHIVEPISIAYEEEALLAKATALAKQLNLPINNHAPKKLLVTSEKLCLKFDGIKPLFPDFSPSAWKKRHQAGKNQGLVRACKPKENVSIIDATAGWGRDASILASFGARVTMLERNPIMAALLKDALYRYETNLKLAELPVSSDCNSTTSPPSNLNHLKLNFYPLDALDFLKMLHPLQYPDVIYIDPMHPQRQKTALVKKNMQVLQQVILEEDRKIDDVLTLLKLAITLAQKRVVVKWPSNQAPIIPSQGNILEKTIRFDIYTSIS